MLKKIMMIVLGFFSTSSYSAVNLQTGSWMWTVTLDEVDIRFNSRSLHQGWWGQGWCSPLDQALDRSPQGSVEFIRCGNKENSAQITKRNGEYRVGSQNAISVFDEDLQLKSVHGSGRHLVIEKRTEDQFFLSINGRPLILTVQKKDRRVIQALSINLKMDFKYSKNLLTRVESELKTEEFIYDHMDNMIRIDLKHGVDQRSAMIFYNEEDRVMEVRSPSQSCSTRYQYKEIKEQSSVSLYSSVNRLCPDMPTSKTILSRFDQTRPGEVQLAAIREVSL